jgi:micrococcal nuclease
MAIKPLIISSLTVIAMLSTGVNGQPSKPKTPKVAKVYPTYPATLKRIVDGDTVVLLIGGVPTTVRMCGIDAAESKSRFGSAATTMLRSLLENEVLSVAVVGKDKYQRTVGSVYAQAADKSLSIQAAMARTGLAYYYSASICPDRQEVIDADNQAKAASLGMRSVPGFPAPWDSRALPRKAVPALSPLLISAN